MIRKMMLNAAILSCSLASTAQMTSYTLLSSDPDDYKRSVVYVDLFTADTYLNPNLGSAVKAETVIGNRIMPWLQMKYSWADANTHHVVSGFPTNASGLKKQFILDAGGALFLVSKNKDKRVKVVLSSHSFGGYTHTKYLMVPSTIKRMFGVEGGVYYNRRALEFEDKSHALYSYKSTTGSYAGPIEDVGSTSSAAGAPTGESYKPLSMTNIMSIYGGIHYRKITNTSIRASGYGKRTNATIMDWYADIMLAPYVPIADVVDNTGQTFELVAAKGAINHLGWKAGATYHTAKTFSFEYNFEFGKKPGPSLGKGFMTNGAYISMGLGFSLGFDTQFKRKQKTVTTEKTSTETTNDDSSRH
ncbi:MAG: hypothetical protein JWQ38_3712 [Flavipsychrobacter sp.]|nr:hypothetical protein [Flavipsychrobacter sp.]